LIDINVFPIVHKCQLITESQIHDNYKTISYDTGPN